MKNRKFDNINDQCVHDTLVDVYNALDEKGYNAIGQLAGYLFSGDHIYITPYKDARKKIEAIDRDELMEHILKGYFGI